MIEDIIVALMAIVILLVARFFALEIPFIEVGFFCDQDDIGFPNRPDTVPSHTMFLLYAIVILILVPVTELSLVRRITGSIMSITVRRVQVHPFFFKVLFFWATYTCGVLATSVATNVFKRTSSRLRPNFMATCQPANISRLCPLGSHAYIGEVTCLGVTSPDEHFSFPSSHASHSLYFVVFTICYLQNRMRVWAIVRAFVQYSVFVLAGYICLSRVRDFKHRYTDVVGGAILGIVIGYGMIHLILHNFRHLRYPVAKLDALGQPMTVNSRKQSCYGTMTGANSIEHLVM